MTNPPILCYTNPRNQEKLLSRKELIMIHFNFAYEYECEAVFCSEEYGYAKHAHFKISKNCSLA